MEFSYYDTNNQIKKFNTNIAITEYEKNICSYNQDKAIGLCKELYGIRHVIIADDFLQLLNNVKANNIYTEVELLKNVDLMLRKINSENIIIVFDYLRERAKKEPDQIIKSMPLLKDNHYVREKILNYLDKCLEEYYDYKPDFQNENSQVVNKFHTGDIYTVDCKNEKMTITNTKTGKQSTLNLNKLVEDIPLQYQIELKKYLSELPGEVLMDLSIIETGTFKSLQNKWFDKLFALITGASGCYTPSSKIISLGGYDKDGLVTWTDALEHELGHALDYYNGEPLSSNCDEFNKAFSKGKKKLVANGYAIWKNNILWGDYEYNRNNDNNSIGLSNSNYATANVNEMFAECYTYLMTGTCQSAAMLEDFFPECLRIASEMIEQIRALPDEVRHKK